MQTLTPLKYFGQREALIADILKFIGNRRINTLYDLFSGSGSISFALMHHKVATAYCINDTLPLLQHLWTQVRDTPETLISMYQSVAKQFLESTQRDETYYLYLQKFNDTTDLAEKTAFFTFLINYSQDHIPYFDENQKLKLKPAVHVDINSLYDNCFSNQIKNLHKLFKQCTVNFSNKAFHLFLENIDATDFVILDPPYPKQDEQIYFNLTSARELKTKLETAIEKLNNQQIPFILFYGAGDLDESHYFLSEDLIHLNRLSSHPLFGNFLEHIYISKNLNISDSLPNHFVHHSILEKQGYEKTLDILLK